MSARLEEELADDRLEEDAVEGDAGEGVLPGPLRTGGGSRPERAAAAAGGGARWVWRTGARQGLDDAGGAVEGPGDEVRGGAVDGVVLLAVEEADHLGGRLSVGRVRQGPASGRDIATQGRRRRWRMTRMVAVAQAWVPAPPAQPRGARREAHLVILREALVEGDKTLLVGIYGMGRALSELLDGLRADRLAPGFFCFPFLFCLFELAQTRRNSQAIKTPLQRAELQQAGRASSCARRRAFFVRFSRLKAALRAPLLAPDCPHGAPLMLSSNSLPPTGAAPSSSWSPIASGLWNVCLALSG